MSITSQFETKPQLEVFNYLNKTSCDRIVKFVEDIEEQFPFFFVNHGSNRTKKGVKRAEFGDIPEFRELISEEAPEIAKNDRLTVVKYMGLTSLTPHVDHTKSSPVTSIQFSRGIRQVSLYNSTQDEKPFQSDFMNIGDAVVIDGSTPHGIANLTDSVQYAILAPDLDIRQSA